MNQAFSKIWIVIILIVVGIMAIVGGGFYAWQKSTKPSITLLSPNGGEIWAIGSTYTIRWTSQNIPQTDKISIHIRRVPPPPLPETGQEFDPIIFIELENTGSVDWTISDMYPVGNYIIEVNSYPSIPITKVISDESDASFRIESSSDEIADWKVYRNEKYGFEVKYPSYFRLGYITSLDDPELEKIDDLNKGLPSFKGVPEDDGLYIHVMAFNSLLEISDEPWEMVFTKKDAREERQKLEQSVIGDPWQFRSEKPYGKVIGISERKAAQYLKFSPQWGGYNAYFIIYNNDGDRIELNIYLKSLTKEEAEKETRHVIFSKIFPTFKFIEISEEAVLPNTPMMLDIDVSTTAGSPYTIGWRAVEEATNYILERDTDSSFSSPIIVSSRTLNSFSETLSPSVSTRYYFRVKAYNKYGFSSWSKTTELWVEVCLLPETPVLTDPGISVNKHEPFTLNWTSVRGATKYQLQRDTNLNFSDPYPIPPNSEQNSRTDSPQPEVTTTYYYRVKACNDCGCGSWSNIVDMRVIVPSITVISPNGGERWVIGNTYDITWTAPGVDTAAISVCFDLVSGRQCTHLMGVHAGAGIWSWPIDPNAPYVPGDHLKIKITAHSDSTIYDESNNYFSIVQPSITVISPNGGEVFHYGEFFTRKARVDSRKNGELSYYLIDSSGNKILIDKENTFPSEDGQFYLTGSQLIERSPLLPAGTNYKAFVTFVSDDGLEKLEDYSDDFFSITEAASTLSALALVSPNGGEIWETGKTYRIKWDSIGGNDFVRIYIVDDSILGSGSTNYIIPDNGSVPVEQGYYDWIIDKKILPAGKGNNYKIRIDGVYNSSISDESDAPFSILP